MEFGFGHGVTAPPAPEGTHLEAYALDPVCGMRMGAWESRYTTLWKGRKVHFCSSDCVQAFKLFPKRFAVDGAAHKED